MAIYAKFGSEEKNLIKKTISEALDFTTNFKKTGKKFSKLKRQKKNSMIGLITAIKEINNEIEKIKESLPQPSEFPKKPEKVKKIIIKNKAKIKKSEKPKKIKFKSEYELELNQIREKIEKL